MAPICVMPRTGTRPPVSATVEHPPVMLQRIVDIPHFEQEGPAEYTCRMRISHFQLLVFLLPKHLNLELVVVQSNIHAFVQRASQFCNLIAGALRAHLIGACFEAILQARAIELGDEEGLVPCLLRSRGPEAGAVAHLRAPHVARLQAHPGHAHQARLAIPARAHSAADHQGQARHFWVPGLVFRHGLDSNGELVGTPVEATETRDLPRTVRLTPQKIRKRHFCEITHVVRPVGPSRHNTSRGILHRHATQKTHDLADEISVVRLHFHRHPA
mmetsp:Transcript_17648/g.45356  ORF Transcript_17648/g.45356 Transcript_17648/m.45356 type:complete len:272 (-) Transcript_17648:1257-2072(-)